MSVRKVLSFPDPRLKEVSAPVENFDEDLKDLLQDLYDTLRDQGGLGLAAPQIGVHLQILVAESTGEFPITLINPEIVQTFGQLVKSREGCLSVPGVYANVSRKPGVQIKTHKLEGESAVFTFEGRDAVVIQHEMDHLRGVLFIDHLAKVERSRVLRRYRKVKKRATKPRR